MLTLIVINDYEWQVKITSLISILGYSFFIIVWLLLIKLKHIMFQMAGEMPAVINILHYVLTNDLIYRFT